MTLNQPRPRRRLALLGIVSSLVLLLVACAGQAPSPRSEPIGEDLALATFDSAYAMISRHHGDLGGPEVDWEALRSELRSRAFTTSSDTVRTLIRTMIDRLDLSHFGLITREASRALDAARGGEGGGGAGTVGLDVRLLDGQLVVTGVEDDSPAAAAGIGKGWILLGIGDMRFADLMERLGDQFDPRERALQLWSVASYRLDGPVGSDVSVTVADGDDREHEFTLTRKSKTGEVSRFGNLPPLNTRLDHRWLEQEGRRVGYIRFNIWLLPVAAHFDAAIETYREADGLIIDLRGNLGGVAGMAMGFSGHLLDENLALGTMTTGPTTLHLRANPRLVNAAGQRVKPFAGPVVILQDALSLSTSEIFAGGLQSLGRVHVVGETSGGQALPSRLVTLPNRDVLQYAFSDFVDPDGVRLEGRGVIPDQEVLLSRDDLLAGRDAPLAAALEWISTSTH